MKRRFTREQRTTIVNGVLCVLLILVILQLWLFTATMDAYLAGDVTIVLPAALTSLACFALNVGILRYIYKMES